VVELEVVADIDAAAVKDIEELRDAPVLKLAVGLIDTLAEYEIVGEEDAVPVADRVYEGADPNDTDANADTDFVHERVAEPLLEPDESGVRDSEIERMRDAVASDVGLDVDTGVCDAVAVEV
jgi:hypothetical protein